MDWSTSLAWRVYLDLLLWVSASIKFVVADCGPKPISIPIADVILPNNRSHRGVFGEVGSPAQNISFEIDLFLNNTWVYNVTHPLCPNDTTTAQCSTQRGGLYDPARSASHKTYLDVALPGDNADTMAVALGTDAGIPVQSSWTTDDLTLGDVTLHNFRIGMPGFDFGGPSDRQANIGLGQSSTLLQRLKDEGHIASRSFSYWWGLDNALSRNTMDGQIVLGGYDAAKVVGQPFTQPLQNSSISLCPTGMTIPLTNMLLNFPNDSQADLNPRSVLTGCIQPGAPLVMVLPADNFQDFESETGTSYLNTSAGIYFNTPLYSPDNVYPGELQVQVQGGPAITIPNDAMIVPESYVDNVGKVQSNDSAPSLLICPNDFPAPNLNLANTFFTGAYLSVNLDERTWTVWEANATTDSKLVAIGEKNCQDSTESPDSANDGAIVGIDSSQSPSLSTGAIAGITISAICICLFVLAAFIFTARKRKAKRKFKISAPLGDAAAHGGSQNGHPPPAIIGNQWMPEMTGNTALATELHASRDPLELPHEHAKRNFPELPHTNNRTSPIELAHHNSRYWKSSQFHADAFELSSTPRT